MRFERKATDTIWDLGHVGFWCDHLQNEVQVISEHLGPGRSWLLQPLPLDLFLSWWAAGQKTGTKIPHGRSWPLVPCLDQMGGYWLGAWEAHPKQGFIGLYPLQIGYLCKETNHEWCQIPSKTCDSWPISGQNMTIFCLSLGTFPLRRISFETKWEIGLGGYRGCLEVDIIVDQARSACGDVHDKGPQKFRQHKGESDLKNAPTFRGIMKWDPFLWGHLTLDVTKWLVVIYTYWRNFDLIVHCFWGLVIYIKGPTFRKVGGWWNILNPKRNLVAWLKIFLLMELRVDGFLGEKDVEVWCFWKWCFFFWHRFEIFM